MALVNRQTLKNYFKKGSSPNEMHFAHLIDSTVNIVEDGIGRGVDDGFRIAPQGYSKKLISFFQNARNRSPSWFIGFNDSKDALGFHDSDEKSRLILKEGGNVGIGTDHPMYRLEVKGTAAFDTRTGSFARGMVPADGQWHNVLSELDGIQGFEIMARAKGRKGSGKYSIAHAIALSTFGGRGSSSKISVTNARYGGFFNKIQFRWKGEVNNYNLQIRTRRHFGLNDQTGDPYFIIFNLTRLWNEEEVNTINANYYL